MGSLRGTWLTGHWLWAPACGFLVLVAAVAISEALRARGESGSEAGNKPPMALTISGNTSLGPMTVTGGNIQSGTFTTINQDSKTVKWGIGGVAGIVALLTLGTAFGGTLYISQQTNGAVMESPPSLAAGGSLTSPGAAVKGFLGDELLGDSAGVCSYVLPDEQQTCVEMADGQTTIPSTQGTSLGTAQPIVNGTLALVPIVGKLCISGQCQTYTASGLTPGTSFQQAFQQAMNSSAGGNLIPCEEIGNSWYVSLPPSSQGCLYDFAAQPELAACASASPTLWWRPVWQTPAVQS